MTVIDKKFELFYLLTRGSLFGSATNIASLIYKYWKDPKISSLIKDITDNKLIGSANELLIYVQRLIRDCPTVAHLDLTNPLELRKACLFFQNNYHSINTAGVGLFNGFYPDSVIMASLMALGELFPVNAEDPITLIEIDKEDLFVSQNGQNFSLTSLVHYHNTRDYRGTQGEQHGSKFLINPINNIPFHSQDAENIMLAALRKNLPPILHLSNAKLPNEYVNSFLHRLYSPAKLYTTLSARIHPTPMNQVVISP